MFFFFFSNVNLPTKDQGRRAGLDFLQSQGLVLESVIDLNFKTMKKLSFILACLLLGFSTLSVSPSFAGDELHVCPGSGEKCEATITFRGETVKVSSAKTPGSGAVVVVEK